uniref:Uncharacterized protein n=1 Tax=Arundo donax TaxID=35708 RepID=A0A0A9CQM8_ARUDO
MYEWNWCLYVWDFENKKVIVLDPVQMVCGKVMIAKKKHKDILPVLHEALMTCKQNVFLL